MVSLATFILLVAGCGTAFAATEASIEDFPSTVQVETGALILWTQSCVGSIITRRHVLTAASCVTGINLLPIASLTLRVRVGANQRGLGGTTYSVQSTARHPDYDGSDSNVGIIRLSSQLTLSARVQPTPMSEAGVEIAADVDVVSVGWGRTAQNVLWTDRKLYSADLVTTDHDACVAKYQEPLIPFTVTDNHICLRIPGTDSSNWGLRDAGTPVFENGTLVAFITHGTLAGVDYPLVATAVSPFRSWIDINSAV